MAKVKHVCKCGLSDFCFVKFSTNVKKKKKKNISISCSPFWGKESPNFEKKLDFFGSHFYLDFGERGEEGDIF
jgi:hypothetical protein